MRTVHRSLLAASCVVMLGTFGVAPALAAGFAIYEQGAKAMGMAGYVSGITMISAEDPQTMLVIGTWEKLDHWLQWKDSAERKQFEAMLEVYQDQPAEYEVYFVGSPFGEQQR